jgi:hypothetical protein
VPPSGRDCATLMLLALAFNPIYPPRGRHSRGARTTKTGLSREARYACACGRGTPGRRLLGTASQNCCPGPVCNCQHRPHDHCCDNHRRGQVPDRCVPCSVRFKLPVRAVHARQPALGDTHVHTFSASHSLLLSSYGCLVCADGSYIGTHSEAGRGRALVGAHAANILSRSPVVLNGTPRRARSVRQRQRV